MNLTEIYEFNEGLLYYGQSKNDNGDRIWTIADTPDGNNCQLWTRCDLHSLASAVGLFVDYFPLEKRKEIAKMVKKYLESKES